jgi:hypothetical protein
MSSNKLKQINRLWRFAFPTISVLLLLNALPAFADLDSVVVGGELTIRGNWWDSSFNGGDRPIYVRYETRWPSSVTTGRAIGGYLGGQNVVSHFGWDSDNPDYRLVEQRTRLHVRANFTQDVSAFIEFDSFDAWGEDFRSNYLTGIDGRARTDDDVELHQAYIDVNSAFGIPLSFRVGRQELVFGGGWLLGDNTSLPEFTGLSFDGIRATYEHDLFSIDAFWVKLAELSPVEEDGDTDLFGVYAAYKGIENVSIDAYWFWLRDAQSLKDDVDPLERYVGRWFGLGDYDPTNLHTVGARFTGATGGFDFVANVAYQFGDADKVGALFNPYYFGDDNAEFGAWAGDFELGYAFEYSCLPRVYIGGAYFDGEDNREIDLLDSLNPFAAYARPDASVSFNRLFSNKIYSYFFDENGELSNFWTLRAGVSAHPCEKIETGFDVAYFAVIEPFDSPLSVKFGDLRVIFDRAPFLTHKSDDDLGWETTLWLRYRYSNDLTFEAGWAHLFTGDGLAEGNFNDMNGLLYNGGSSTDDANYFYLQAKLKF